MIDFKSLNHVTLIGRLAEDPEIKRVGTTKVAYLELVTERGRFDYPPPGGSGQTVPLGDKPERGVEPKLGLVSEVFTHTIHCWDGMAFVSRKLQKYDLVAVQGHLAEWEKPDPDGGAVKRTIVVAHALIPLLATEEERREREQIDDMLNKNV